MQTPHEIYHEGHYYTLAKPLRVVSSNPPISEGPFYEREDVNPDDYLFLPDAEFLLGQTPVPKFMHQIQQRKEVTS